jgi:hypothetical protein
MKSRPILFTAPMVRAILEGRKTQTRRVLKPQPRLFEIDDKGTPCQVGVIKVEGRPYNQLTLGSERSGVIEAKPKLYSIGDELWVRETWATDSQVDHIKPSDLSRGEPIFYIADSKVRITGCHPIKKGKNRQSIFMPRAASRIQLRITDIRCEKLQDISEADAIAEGILVGKPLPQMPKSKGDIYHNGISDPINGWTRSPIQAYRELWKSINGAGSWDQNPWVWAITFERVI